MLGGSVGTADGYGKTKDLPFFQNFYGGGLGSVRGYESGTLGPKVYDVDGDKISYGGNKMLSGTAELLFPFPGIKDSRSVRLSLVRRRGAACGTAKPTTIPAATRWAAEPCRTCTAWATATVPPSRKSCATPPARR